MKKAFVLGAGLGERLRPLTDQLPKPLVPVLHRPLITWAFQHLATQLGVTEFVVNSWHLPESYAATFPEGQWQGMPITVRKDHPVLLDTGGGMANVADLLDGDEPFAVYNGDVMADFDLTALEREHSARGNLVTLGLRSSGPVLNVAYDADSGLITDMRNQLGTGQAAKFLFTGVYIVSPEFLRHLTAGIKESVVPVFLRLIQAGARIGGCIVDDGHWWDLGSRRSYLELHQQVLDQPDLFPRYLTAEQRLALHAAQPAIASSAIVSPEAKLIGHNVIGPTALVARGAVLENCVLWPGAKVSAGVHLTRCIVRSGITATQSAVDADL
jgi:mannose-1-phosphate guanylyltransferase